MSNQTAVIAFAVFNLMLLVLAFIAWRLLRTPASPNKKASKAKADELAATSRSVTEGQAATLASASSDPSGSGSDETVIDLTGADAAGEAASGDLASAAAGSTTAEPSALHPVLDQVPSRPNSRRFVPGGVPVRDGSVPDFTLAMAHLFTADNGVLNRERQATAEPITLSIQAGPRPVTPLLERVVEALTNIGLEPAQTRPLVHSFSDSAGRCARVRLAHSPAHGDLIEIEIEPSLSPAAMASVMALLSDLDFEPADVMTSTPSRQF